MSDEPDPPIERFGDGVAVRDDAYEVHVWNDASQDRTVLTFEAYRLRETHHLPMTREQALALAHALIRCSTKEDE